MNNSITPGRCDLAPAAIRQALDRYSLNDPDAGVDLASLAVSDIGDVTLAGASAEEVFFRIVQGIKKAAANTFAVAIFGGDNAITYPGMHALNLPFARCGLLTFDAHHDVRDLEGGLTDGNPIRALLRAGLPGANIVQIGIQPFTNSPAYAQVAREAGITVVTADEVYARGIDAAVVGRARIARSQNGRDICRPRHGCAGSRVCAGLRGFTAGRPATLDVEKSGAAVRRASVGPDHRHCRDRSHKRCRGQHRPGGGFLFPRLRFGHG